MARSRVALPGPAVLRLRCGHRMSLLRWSVVRVRTGRRSWLRVAAVSGGALGVDDCADAGCGLREEGQLRMDQHGARDTLSHAMTSIQTGYGLNTEDAGHERLERRSVGWTNQERSKAWVCPKFNHPASFAVWTAVMTSPAAIITSTMPVMRKKRPRLMWMPPSVDAVAEDDREQNAEDGTEPTRGGVAAGVERGEEEHDGLEPLAASTARNAINTRALAEPLARADPAWFSRSPLRSRGCRRIHRIM